MGRIDVDAMLDEMSPQQFTEWIAAYNLDPWGMEMEQSAAVGAAICNTVLIVLASFGEGRPPEPLDANNFLPNKNADAKDRHYLTAEESAARMKMMYGKR